MSIDRQWLGRIVTSVQEIDAAAWDRLFLHPCDRWAFRRAIELAPPDDFQIGAVTVSRGGQLIAAAPLFQAHYRLDTSLTGPLRSVVSALHRLTPSLIRIPMIGLGSPLSDRIGLGFAPELGASERADSFEVLVETVGAFARSNRAHLVALKDMTATEAVDLDPVLKTMGFTALPSQPEAVLDLPFSGVEGYLASLSQSMRGDLRRKIRRSSNAVRLERIGRIGNLEGALMALYEGTRARAGVDFDGFDAIHPHYLGRFMEAAGERAHLMLGWVGDALASFSIGIIGDDRFIAHKIGLAYPLARDHDLYFLNWMAVVELCIERGIPRAEMGQTTYALKKRLGCRMEPSRTYFRHRAGPINALMRRLAPLAGFDSLEQRSGRRTA